MIDCYHQLFQRSADSGVINIILKHCSPAKVEEVGNFTSEAHFVVRNCLTTRLLSLSDPPCPCMGHNMTDHSLDIDTPVLFAVRQKCDELWNRNYSDNLEDGTTYNTLHVHKGCLSAYPTVLFFKKRKREGLQQIYSRKTHVSEVNHWRSHILNWGPTWRRNHQQPFRTSTGRSEQLTVDKQFLLSRLQSNLIVIVHRVSEISQGISSVKFETIVAIKEKSIQTLREHGRQRTSLC